MASNATTSNIECPIWEDGHEASLHSQWTRPELFITEEALIDSPRAGGLYRMTEEAFSSIQLNPLNKTQKLKISEWIRFQRRNETKVPVVTLEIIDSLTNSSDDTPSSISVRAQKLLQYIIEETENIGDQVPISKYGYEALIVSESVEWTEIFFLLNELTNQNLIDYNDTRDPAKCLPVVTAEGHAHIQEPSVVQRESTMRVFISHSGKDATLAKSLVNLLQKSMRLSSDDIRCSSVDGYRLPGGVSTDERLRTEVHDAKLIIGLITPNSLNSLYVAFELGARWGARKPMIPLLASGANTDHLGGPLSGINALSCESESQVNQLIEDSALHLGIDPEKPSSLTHEVKQVVQASANSPPEVETTPPEKPAAQLSPKATELLLGATKGNDGHVIHLRTTRGVIIRAGQAGVGEIGDRRSEAAWLAALKQLVEVGLVEDRSGNGKRYDPTDKGYAVADELRGAEN